MLEHAFKFHWDTIFRRQRSFDEQRPIRGRDVDLIIPGPFDGSPGYRSGQLFELSQLLKKVAEARKAHILTSPEISKHGPDGRGWSVHDDGKYSFV